MKSVFVMGCERSGTTFLGSFLGAHSQCVVTPESQFKVVVPPSYREDGTFDARKTFEEIRSSWHLRKWETPIEFSAEELEKISTYGMLIQMIVRKYAESHHREKEAKYWIDHTPNNIEHVDFLRKTFPGAKFIHIVRDGRGVAASFERVSWGPDTILESACHWMKKIAFGFAAEVKYPDEVMMIRYEDILEDPESAARKMCRFIGIDFEARMLKADGMVVPSYTRHQHELVGAQPTQSKADSWRTKLSAREIEIFEYETGRMLQFLGYPRLYEEPRRPSKPEYIRFYFHKRKKRIYKELKKAIHKVGIR